MKCKGKGITDDWKTTFNEDPLIQTLNAEIAQASEKLNHLRRLREQRRQLLWGRWKYKTNYHGHRDRLMALSKQQTSRRRAVAEAAE